MPTGRLDDISGNNQIFVEKLTTVDVVSLDPANLGRREMNISRALLSEELLNLILTKKIKLGASSNQDAGMSTPLQGPNDG